MFRRISFYLPGCLLLLLLVRCNAPSGNQADIAGNSPVCELHTAVNYRLQAFTQVLADSETGYTIEDILQPDRQRRFVPFPKKNVELLPHKMYWGKLQLKNNLPDSVAHLEWVLHISETFTNITLFRMRDDSTWVSEVNGSFVPAHQKKFVPKRSSNLFKLVLPPGKEVTLYFRGEGGRSAIVPSFQAYLQPIDRYYDHLVKSKTWSTLFTGLLLMMLFYNLLNYFFTRDSSYICYTGYLGMVLIYTAYSTDDLADWFGGFVFTENPGWFSFFKAAIYAGLMFYLAFIRSFLDLEHLLPRWDRYFRLLIWLGVPFIALFIFLAARYHFSYTIDDGPTLLYIGIVSISCFYFIYPLYKTRDPKGLFITAGIAVISLGFLLTLYSRMTQTPFTVFYLKLCTILEILIFSMGLAYRQRQQELAKQQADFALRESRLLQEKKQMEANRLQELNEFKSRFFTNITHEFRTPLTVILGMAERVIGDRVTQNNPTTIAQPLALIRRNGENLLRLVNQILDLSKVESNALKMNYVQGDILAYTRYIAESLHSLANAQNLLLRVESNQMQIVMDYDPERFLQIIHNLLSNAIKFTPSGGKVNVRADLEGQWLHIAVTDSGAGIPQEELPHIFERFFQAGNQEHASAGGAGIGLSLTRELVKAMGGEISVESTVGVGSSFFVKLPVTNNSAFEEKPLGKVVGRPFVPPPVDGDSEDHQRILIIEDNPDVVEYLSACLQGAGGALHEGDREGHPYVLDFAYNGQAGIEKALEHVPDLIVSDVMMPVKNGIEVLETLKKDERTSHIPIVLLTAKADVQSRLTGLRQGADAYLSKPFHQEELLVALENLLASRRKLQLKYQQNLLAADAPVPAPIAPDQEDAFLQNIRAIIDANYTKEDFGLPQLCQKTGMSRSQLFRKMKALTDIAPSDLIRSHRLHKAKALLESGAVNVAEAAWQVGFKDPSYFTKLYQEEFGIAPGATRK